MTKMKKFLFFLVSLATILFFELAKSASIRSSDNDEDSRMLRSLALPQEDETPQKRYGNQYLTKLKAKFYDKAALQRFLQQRYLGKRLASHGESENVEDNSVVSDSPISVVVIVLLPLVDDVTNNLPLTSLGLI